MPILPSGLNLAMANDALIDTGRNWFDCPEGHLWYWDIAPEEGAPPFELGSTILSVPTHAPAPKNRNEAKNFIRVLEMSKDGLFAWRGEWLASFPQYMTLDERDAAAWQAWLEKPETLRFLDETVEKCHRLAKIAQETTGYAIFRDSP